MNKVLVNGWRVGPTAKRHLKTNSCSISEMGIRSRFTERSSSAGTSPSKSQGTKQAKQWPRKQHLRGKHRWAPAWGRGPPLQFASWARVGRELYASWAGTSVQRVGALQNAAKYYVCSLVKIKDLCIARNMIVSHRNSLQSCQISEKLCVSKK